MAYSGSTAASSVANPARLAIPGLGSIPNTTGLSTTANTQAQQGGQLYTYTSTNLTTDITASGFFSDAETLGMRPGDIVMGSQFSSAGSSVTTFIGSIVSISTAGAASLSTGSLITSTFG